MCSPMKELQMEHLDTFACENKCKLCDSHRWKLLLQSFAQRQDLFGEQGRELWLCSGNEA